MDWLAQKTLTILALKYIGMSQCCLSYNLLPNLLLDSRCLMLYVIPPFSLLADLPTQSTQNKPISSHLRTSKHFMWQHTLTCILHLDSTHVMLVMLMVVVAEVFCGFPHSFSVIYGVILSTYLYPPTSKFLTFYLLSSCSVMFCCIASVLKQH